MFGEFHGLPVHALVVHAAVTLTPLAAVLALLCLVPKWQRALRWPALAASVLALTTLFVARQSGQVLKASLGEGVNGSPVGTAIQTHQMWAGRLLWSAAFLVVFVGLAVLATRVTTSWLPRVANGLAALTAIVVLALVAVTGEAGATAVWNPAGTQSYTGTASK